MSGFGILERVWVAAAMALWHSEQLFSTRRSCVAMGSTQQRSVALVTLCLVVRRSFPMAGRLWATQIGVTRSGAGLRRRTRARIRKRGAQCVDCRTKVGPIYAQRQEHSTQRVLKLLLFCWQPRATMLAAAALKQDISAAGGRQWARCASVWSGQPHSLQASQHASVASRCSTRLIGGLAGGRHP